MIEGWEETTIGDAPFQIIDGDRGKTYPKKSEFEPEGYCLFLNTKNVTASGFVFDDLNFITEERDQLLRKGKLKRKDIVLTTRGTVGNVAFYSENIPYDHVRINSGMVIVRPSSIDPSFNHQLFKFLKPEFDSFATGSAQPQLPIRDLKLINIILPPPMEQRAIAEVLSSLDDKIELLHRQNATLEALAETLFRQYFIEEAQDDWPTERLGGYVKVHRGLSYNGSGLTNEGDGIPMHNLNSIYEGGQYKHDGIKFYKGEYRDRHKVSAGDVIVANTEQGHDLLLIGSAARVPDSFGREGIFSQHLYKIEVRKLLTNEFLYFLLKSLEVRNQIQSATNGSTVNMLPADGIEWAEFRVPPLEQIENFTGIVADLLRQKDLLYVESKTLEKLRNTLLPKLMSGEVRVQFEREAA